MTEDLKEQIRKAQAEMSEQWKLVPVDLTTEMLGELTNGDSKKNALMKLRYSQMLSAAPTQGADARPVITKEQLSRILEENSSHDNSPYVDLVVKAINELLAT